MISTHLQNRNGIYHLRLRIPSDLSVLIPQAEIVKSLKTTNPKTATRCKINGYSNSLGKWYQRFNREYVTQDKLKTFHSLRHSFSNTLKQLGIQKELVMELMGHSDSSETFGRYAKRFKPELLKETIDRLQYPNVTFHKLQEGQI
jgi:integrase